MPTQFERVWIQGSGRFLPGPAIDNEAMDAYIAPLNRISGRIKRRILSENQVLEGRDAAAVPASQQVFDELAQGARRQNEPAMELRQESKETRAPASPATEYGKVQDLRLDDALQKKSEVIEQESDTTVGFEQAGAAAEALASRSRRIEQSVLPEPVLPAEGSADSDRPLQNVRITTRGGVLGPVRVVAVMPHRRSRSPGSCRRPDASWR